MQQAITRINKLLENPMAAGAYKAGVLDAIEVIKSISNCSTLDWGKLESELYHQLRNHLSRPMADKASKEVVENLKKSANG